MSISKSFGHPLSDRSKNGAGFSITTKGGTISASDFAPGSKGIGDLTINSTAGGGPFHVKYSQNGKVIRDESIPYGAVVSYSIGVKFGARPDVSEGDITFSISGVAHDAHIFNNFDDQK